VARRRGVPPRRRRRPLATTALAAVGLVFLVCFCCFAPRSRLGRRRGRGVPPGRRGVLGGHGRARGREGWGGGCDLGRRGGIGLLSCLCLCRRLLCCRRSFCCCCSRPRLPFFRFLGDHRDVLPRLGARARHRGRGRRREAVGRPRDPGPGPRSGACLLRPRSPRRRRRRRKQRRRQLRRRRGRHRRRVLPRGRGHVLLCGRRRPALRGALDRGAAAPVVGGSGLARERPRRCAERQRQRRRRRERKLLFRLFLVFFFPPSRRRRPDARGAPAPGGMRGWPCARVQVERFPKRSERAREEKAVECQLFDLLQCEETEKKMKRNEKRHTTCVP